MFANILVPLDGSSLSERALPYAARLAKGAGAHLRLLHVQPKELDSKHPWIEADVGARIEDLAGRLRAQGVQATARTIAAEPPVDGILAGADEPPADLIVMSTHGRSGIGRWLYGSVADAILRRSIVPVMLIPSTCDHVWSADRPLKILVPLDGSDNAEVALGPAQMLRRAMGAELFLLRVVDQSSDVVWRFDPVGLQMREIPPVQIEHAQAYLTTIASAPAPGGETMGTLVDVGTPASTISKVARQEDIDLIVMATHGRTGLARLTMGSVATTTVHRAHTPVLLVRSPGLEQSSTEAAPDLDTVSPPSVWPPIGIV